MRKKDPYAPQPICTVDGCDRHATTTKGTLCRMHYLRLKRWGTTAFVPRHPPIRPLDQDRLKQLLEYSPETGVFTWVAFRGGAALPGAMAGQATRRGYLRVVVDRRHYMAHRLAWLYMTGAWPRFEIDHINGVKTDNRLSNLRDVDHLTNIRAYHPRRNPITTE